MVAVVLSNRNIAAGVRTNQVHLLILEKIPGGVQVAHLTLLGRWI